MRAALLILVVLLLFVSACEEKDDVLLVDPENIVLTYVFDSSSSQPLADCWVRLNDSTESAREKFFNTDSSGFSPAVWLGKGPDVETLYVGKDGYQPFDTVFVIPSGESLFDTLEVFLIVD